MPPKSASVDQHNQLSSRVDALTLRIDAQTSQIDALQRAQASAVDALGKLGVDLETRLAELLKRTIEQHSTLVSAANDGRRQR